MAFDWLMEHYPIPGFDYELKWTAPRIQRVQIGGHLEEMDRPQNAYVLISGGGMQFIARSAGTGRPITFKEKRDQSESYAKNIYALRSKIRNRILNPVIEVEMDRRGEIEKLVRKAR